jgi:hypothetical protein
MKEHGLFLPNAILSTLVIMSLGTLGMLFGCATTGQSVAAGGAGGAVLGAGVGALADPGEGGAHRIRNVLIGTGVGAVLGAGAGLLIHAGNESSKAEGLEKGKQQGQKEIEARANSPDGNPPRLIPPRTEARWIPDVVRGNTFVPGHFEYVILEGARWDLGH